MSAAVLLLAGCTSTTAGSPQPSSVAAGGTSTTGTSKPPLTLPSRPATLSVAGVDPCALVSQDKKAGLGIDRPANTAGSTDAVPEGRACSCSVAAWGAYEFDVSATYNASKWLEQTRARAGANRVVDVGGYPAVVTYASDQPGGCTAVVDISDSAVLGVAVLDRRDYKALDGKVVCANTLKAAGVALTALKAMQK